MHSLTSVFSEGSEESDFMPDFEEDTSKFCGAGAHDRVFSPRDPKVRLWQTFVPAFSFLGSILISFMASFSTEFFWLWIVVYIFDIIYCLDIVFNFYITYHNHNGIQVTDRRKIVKRYLRTRFIFDILSIFPTDAFYQFWHGVSTWKSLSRFRLNRLIQFFRTLQLFGRYFLEIRKNNFTDN